MTEIDRRVWLAGAGALVLARGGPASAAEADAPYDYLFLDLEDGQGMTPPRAYAEVVKARLPQIQAAGGEVLGLFTPQIGWVARQSALLVRWGPQAKGRDSEVSALARGKAVRFVQRGRITPTSRPMATDKPRPGGIYVHRWFVVENDNVPEFLTLSTEGWRDFETRFEANIFGLFTAERSSLDRQKGVTRLLLITRYKDHGVWEASRDPSTAAMKAFQRRSAITKDTWNASTLLVPI
jgi:hypothetical protein